MKPIRAFAIIGVVVLLCTALAGCRGARNEEWGIAETTIMNQHNPVEQDLTSHGISDFKLVSAAPDRIITYTGDWLSAFDLNSGKATLRSSINLSHEIDADSLKIIPVPGARYVVLQSPANGLRLADMDNDKVFTLIIGTLPGMLSGAVDVSPSGEYLAFSAEKSQERSDELPDKLKNLNNIAVLVDLRPTEPLATLIYNTPRKIIAIKAADDGRVIVTCQNQKYETVPVFWQINKPGVTPVELKWNHYGGECIGVDETAAYIRDVNGCLWFLRPAVRGSGLPFKSSYMQYLGNSQLILRMRENTGSYSMRHVKASTYKGKIRSDNDQHLDQPDYPLTIHPGLGGLLATIKNGNIQLWTGSAGFTWLEDFNGKRLLSPENPGTIMAVGMQHAAGFIADDAVPCGLKFFVYFTGTRTTSFYTVDN